jgi:hypothetical protein
MWDDEINKRIKDAADQYHPAYDENAWDKMELLLDQHLPIEKKRRRKYFLIPLISLLAGGALFFIFYFQNNSPAKNSGKTQSNNNITATNNNITTTQSQEKSSAAIVSSPSSTAKTATALTLNEQPGGVTKSSNNQLKNSDNTSVESITNKTNVNRSGKTSSTVVQPSVETETNIAANTGKNSITDRQQNPAKESAIAETPATVINSPEINQAKKDTVNAKKLATASNIKEPAAKKKLTTKDKSFNNNFAISLSAGPDVSSVGFDKTGRIAINFGLGIRYSLSQQFTLRTGFYKSEKIYSVNKDQYQGASGGNNTEYLYNIDANCKVYEIPVTVSYNFGKAKNHQWFASAGLSSYLMKKESYDYYYKYPNGNMYTKSWSIANQNQHYFSVLDLSAGYEYLFSKRASLLAEPYLKIPLSGIGAGKVKLNSGGILFTFILKPFYKK